MKLVVLALLVTFGCGSKSESSAAGGASAGSGRPTVTDPLGFCDRARMMMMGRRKCFPEDTSIKMGLEEILDLVKDAPADPEPRRRVAVTCAVMLEGMMRAEQPRNCPLDVTDVERTELSTVLAAWYGERTAPPTTGHAAADAALGKLASQRDAACACKDLACARQAGSELEDAMSSDAPTIARDAAAKMVDEVARCRQQLATARPGP
jgi:hypothetical protein